MSRTRESTRGICTCDNSSDDEPMDEGSPSRTSSNASTTKTVSQEAVTTGRGEVTPETTNASPAKAPESNVKRAPSPRRAAPVTKSSPKRRRTVKLSEQAVAKMVKVAVSVGRVAKKRMRDQIRKRKYSIRGTGSAYPPGSRMCRSCMAKERRIAKRYTFPADLFKRLMKQYTQGSGNTTRKRK